MTEESFSRRDLESLRVIVKFCEDIDYLVQLHGSDETDFRENISLQYGCAFALSQIGEHAKRLSSRVREKYPDVNWSGIAGLRDIIAHNYENIDVARIRSTVLNRIPDLEKKCLEIISTETR